MPTNVTAVQTAWTTAKAQLAQLKTDLATVLTDLANLEASRDALYQLGAGDVADWLTTQIQQSVLGYQPRVSAGGGITPQVIAVRASDPTHARDLTTVDQRPISSTTTGQFANLS
jgi:hypothetical protein